MNAIGGYPELELRKGKHYHKGAIRLNTARNCLRYILAVRQYQKVYVPYYTCDAVLEPFADAFYYRTTIEFYNVTDELRPSNLPMIKEGEAFLYTNYFGLMQGTIRELVKKYKNQLIVDNSQAFFDYPYPGIDTFYSARKFFGVPDGAYLYTDAHLNSYGGLIINERDFSYDRMNALLKRIDIGAEQGYADFHSIEEKMSNQPIRRMSKLTEAILESIDYETVRKQRIDNFDTLYYALQSSQDIVFIRSEDAVPLCYPFLARNSALRHRLIENKIYVPTYWPNVIETCSKSSIEYKYATHLLPLPIDQRYGQSDMERIVRNVI